MSKCIKCNKKDGEYIHRDGGEVCGTCIGHYFSCPDCGRVFDNDDYVNGDQGNGFCKDCHSEH